MTMIYGKTTQKLSEIGKRVKSRMRPKTPGTVYGVPLYRAPSKPKPAIVKPDTSKWR